MHVFVISGWSRIGDRQFVDHPMTSDALMVRDGLGAASCGVGERQDVALVERTDLQGTFSLDQALITRHATDAGRPARLYTRMKVGRNEAVGRLYDPPPCPRPYK